MIRRVTEAALARPSAFASYQAAIGAPACHQRFIAEYVRARAGQRILDIGCGVGASLRFVPDGVEYVGVDISPQYIEAARRTYGARGTFICADLGDDQCARLGLFDTAFAFGVLHHLPDETMGVLATLLTRVLRPGGSFVSIDPCRYDRQPLWSRVMMALDRGRHIRTEAEYKRVLASFGPATTRLHLDMLNIRYAMVTCTATR